MAPVPPSAIAIASDSPLTSAPIIFPPVMFTLLAFWVAIVPRPRLVLAPEAVDDPVPPSAIVMSVIPFTSPPVMETLKLSCVAIVPSSKLALAAAALVPPEPPSSIGIVPTVISCPDSVR